MGRGSGVPGWTAPLWVPPTRLPVSRSQQGRTSPWDVQEVAGPRVPVRRRPPSGVYPPPGGPSTHGAGWVSTHGVGGPPTGVLGPQVGDLADGCLRLSRVC